MVAHCALALPHRRAHPSTSIGSTRTCSPCRGVGESLRSWGSRFAQRRTPALPRMVGSGAAGTDADPRSSVHGTASRDPSCALPRTRMPHWPSEPHGPHLPPRSRLCLASRRHRDPRRHRTHPRTLCGPRTHPCTLCTPHSHSRTRRTPDTHRRALCTSNTNPHTRRTPNTHPRALPNPRTGLRRPCPHALHTPSHPRTLRTPRRIGHAPGHGLPHPARLAGEERRGGLPCLRHQVPAQSLPRGQPRREGPSPREQRGRRRGGGRAHTRREEGLQSHVVFGGGQRGQLEHARQQREGRVEAPAQPGVQPSAERGGRQAREGAEVPGRGATLEGRQGREERERAGRQRHAAGCGGRVGAKGRTSSAPPAPSPAPATPPTPPCPAPPSAPRCCGGAPQRRHHDWLVVVSDGLGWWDGCLCGFALGLFARWWRLCDFAGLHADALAGAVDMHAEAGGGRKGGRGLSGKVWEMTGDRQPSHLPSSLHLHLCFTITPHQHDSSTPPLT